MAARATGRSVLHNFRRRLYSTQAAAKPQDAGLPKQDPKLTKLSNGVVVASIENYLPVSRVAVVVNAGSRYEDPEVPGTTHFLRIMSSQSTKSTSGFGLTHNLQQVGSSMTCTTSREHITYSVDMMRDNMQSGLDQIRQIITEPTFKLWEVADIQPQLVVDLRLLGAQPNVQMLDMLHKAAFRQGLGNSLYAPEYMVGNYTPDQLMSFVERNFTADRVAVVGLGVDHDDLCAEASKFTMFPGSGAAAEKSVYNGGELRIHNSNPLVHAAIVSEGPSFSSKDLMACSVLQMVMGTGPTIKYSDGTSSSRLGQAASQATNEVFAVSCINANYSDGGLFGLHVAADYKEIGNILKATFAQFASATKGGVTDQDVSRAKYQLKSAVHMGQEDSHAMLGDMAEQALRNGQLTDLAEVDKNIDAVKLTDVINVAKKIVNGKPSMAVVGNTCKTPYISDLYK